MNLCYTLRNFKENYEKKKRKEKKLFFSGNQMLQLIKKRKVKYHNRQKLQLNFLHRN